MIGDERIIGGYKPNLAMEFEMKDLGLMHFFLTRDDRLIGDCKSNLAVEFEMKDLGLMHYFLGLEVWQRDGCFFIG